MDKAKQPALFDVDHPKSKEFLKNREMAEKCKTTRNVAAQSLKETDAAALQIMTSMGVRPVSDENGRATYSLPLGGKIYIIQQNPSQLSFRVKDADPVEHPQDLARRKKEKEEIEGDEPKLASRE